MGGTVGGVTCAPATWITRTCAARNRPLRNGSARWKRMNDPVEGREAIEQFGSRTVLREQVRLNPIWRQCERLDWSSDGTDCVSFLPRSTRGMLQTHLSTSGHVLLIRISTAIATVAALLAVDPIVDRAQSGVPPATTRNSSNSCIAIFLSHGTRMRHTCGSAWPNATAGRQMR